MVTIPRAEIVAIAGGELATFDAELLDVDDTLELTDDPPAEVARRVAARLRSNRAYIVADDLDALVDRYDGGGSSYDSGSSSW
jgi:hypothetical protein